MKKLIALIAICFSFCQCEDNSRRMTISGELRTDRSFEGETLYLLPMAGNSGRRDSAVVADGRFMFQIDIDSFYVAMLRPKNALQSYHLQPLLVAMEPGKLAVRLDSASHSQGTPLNDILQGWKENKTTYDATIASLRRQIRNAEGEEKSRLEADLKRWEADYSEYSFNFVRVNKDNPIGRFVFTMTQFHFTDEQKKALDMPE